MAVENESKNEDLDLCSVRHKDRDKSGTLSLVCGWHCQGKENYAGSQNLGLRCYYMKNLLHGLDQEHTCLLNAGKDGEGLTGIQSLVKQRYACSFPPSCLSP